MSSPRKRLKSNEFGEKGVDRAERQGPARSQALLSVLRNEAQYCDAVIVVSDNEFPVHRAIVAPLSPFFANAFSSGFKEASERRLVIGEASAAAMSTVLDFAYGIDVDAAFLDDATGVVEVWGLAHRLQISSLTKIAGAAALKFATVENCIDVFHQAKLYGCEKQTEEMFAFIAKRFENVSGSPNFETLHGLELRDFLKSKELVAAELVKYNAIKTWIKSGATESRATHREYLLSHVRFELLDRFDAAKVLEDLDFLPKEVLSTALQRSFRDGLSIPDMFMTENNNHYRYFNKRFLEPETQIAMKIGTLSEALRKPMAPFFFTFEHWVLSATIQFRTDCILLILEFENRFLPCDVSSSLAEDVSSYTFNVLTNMVTEVGQQERTRQVRRLENHIVTKNKISMVVAVSASGQYWRKPHDEADTGNKSLLVRLRCKFRGDEGRYFHRGTVERMNRSSTK